MPFYQNFSFTWSFMIFLEKNRSKYTEYICIIVWLIFDHVIFAIFYSIFWN